MIFQNDSLDPAAAIKGPFVRCKLLASRAMHLSYIVHHIPCTPTVVHHKPDRCTSVFFYAAYCTSQRQQPLNEEQVQFLSQHLHCRSSYRFVVIKKTLIEVSLHNFVCGPHVSKINFWSWLQNKLGN